MMNNNFNLQLNPISNDKYGRNTFIPLDDNMLLSVANDMWEFLKKLHPFLNDRMQIKSLVNSCVTDTNELPFITRSDNLCFEIRTFKQCFPPDSTNADEIIKHPFRYSKGDYSYKIYSFSDQEKKRFINKMKELNDRGIYFDIFYSVYYFDNSILGNYSNGQTKNSFTNAIDRYNSCATDILVADFDHITKEDFNIYYLKFKNLGIEPSITICSGHGFHTIWNVELTSDKSLLKKFTMLLLQNNFPVDSSISDCARILRMPYWFNCKDMSNKEKVNTFQFSTPQTDIIKQTDKKYSINEIFSKLENFYIPVPISTYKGYCTVDYLQKYDIYNKKYLPSNTVSHKALEYLKKAYENIVDIYTLDPTIQKMLLGFQHKYADLVVFFLSLYFTERGYTTDTIASIIQILASLNTFSYSWDDLDIDSKITRITQQYCKASSLAFFKSKQLNIFGDYYGYQKTTGIKIYNALLENVSSIGGPLPLYIYLCMYYILENTSTRSFTIQEISSITGLNSTTIYKNISSLLYSVNNPYGPLDKKYIFKNKHRQSIYFISIIERNWIHHGYMEISFDQLSTVLQLVKNKQFTPTDLCVYLLLRNYSKLPNGCFVSQTTLSSIMGYSSQGFISRSTDKLSKYGLICKSKIDINPYQYKNKYTIL